MIPASATTNPFDDKAAKPDDAALEKALGKSKAHWDALLVYLDECPEVSREWKFYGAKYGWQIKAANRKSAVLYLIPRKGKFVAALALRAKAVEAARSSKLPKELVEEIAAAKESSEGRPARVEVSTARHAGIVKRLVALKLANR